MNFHKYKRWLGVGILAIVCAISPQMVNADTVPEPDGVMGQSVTEEMQADPAKDYVLLSAGLNEQPIDTEMMPLLRARLALDLRALKLARCFLIPLATVGKI